MHVISDRTMASPNHTVSEAWLDISLQFLMDTLKAYPLFSLIIFLFLIKGVKIATSMCNCGSTDQSDSIHYNSRKKNSATEENKAKVTTKKKT